MDALGGKKIDLAALVTCVSLTASEIEHEEAKSHEIDLYMKILIGLVQSVVCQTSVSFVSPRIRSRRTFLRRQSQQS